MFIRKWSDFILNETLKTHDIDLTISDIEYNLSIHRYKFEIFKVENTIKLKLIDFKYIKGIGDLFNILDSLFINRHGWFPSKMEITNFAGMKNKFRYSELILIDPIKNQYYDEVLLTYEPKYDIEEEVPDKLYHLSIKEFDKRISKIGLVPKSGNKLSKHLDRIYVCSDINSCKYLIPQMKLLYNELKVSNRENKINTNWIIYEIDTKDLNLKLFKDPNYKLGYYLIDNIPTHKLKIIEEEK